MSKTIYITCNTCRGIGFLVDVDNPIDVYEVCHKCNGNGYRKVKITKEEVENAIKERDVEGDNQ